jgi:predicted transcriptional regulator
MISLTNDRPHIAIKMLFPKRMSAASRRRVKKIQLIIQCLAARDMKVEDINTILQCSTSGSRKYLRDLVEVGLVQAWTESQSKGVFVTRYSLDAELVTIHKILQWEPDSVGLQVEIVSPKKEDSTALLKRRRVPLIKVSRDPLVAALFGAPGPRD